MATIKKITAFPAPARPAQKPISQTKQATKITGKAIPMNKQIKPTYRIPDQSKLKNIGVGWGGEPPISKGTHQSKK